MSRKVAQKPSPQKGTSVIQATRRYAKDDATTSWTLLLTTLSLLALACFSTLVAPSWILKLGLSVLTGLLLVRAFVIYHDHQHGAILPKSKIGKVLMVWYGMISVSPSSIWKHSHNHHHHHNCTLHDAQIGSFPVLTLREYQTLSPAARRRYLMARHPAVVLLGYLTVFLRGFSSLLVG
jgi:acyl-lipid omega-6 desaturase (Delta-12 desaturase)